MRVVIQHPLAVIVASLVLCGLMCLGIPQFKVDASVKKYIGEDSEVVTHLNWLEAEYIDDNNVFIMLKSTEGTIFTAAMLSAIREFTEAAWRLPHVRRVDSLTNFQHTSVSGDDLVVSDLVPESLTLTRQTVDKIRNIALDEPRLMDLFISPDGKSAAINMLFDVDISVDADRGAITAAVDELQRQFKQSNPDLEVYEAGFVSMMDSMVKASASDVKNVYSISLILIVTALVILFHSFVNGLLVVFVGLLSVVASIGAFGLMGGYLTPPTAMGVLMVLILGLVDCIHIVKNTMKYRAEGKEHREAIFESTAKNFMPIFLTSITTAIGFLSFNFNDFVGIQLLGNYVAFGVMLAFLLAVSLLPAVLCYCNVKPESRGRGSSSFDKFTGLLAQHHRLIIVFSGFILLMSIGGIKLNVLDDSISRHLKSSHPFRQGVRQIEKDLTGAMSAIYSFESASPNGVADPAYMKKVDDFAVWLRQQPGVRHVSSFTDTMKQLNQDLNEGHKDSFHLPATPQLAAQYLLLYELSLPYGLGLTNQVNLSKSASRLVVNVDDFTIQQTTAFLQENTNWLSTHAPEFDTFANSAVLSANLTVEATIWKTLTGAIIALAIIALVLMLTFRAFVPGILCVISVVAPMLITFGLWGIVVGVIDLPATLALCMVIGISVDFSVHFISKYLYAERNMGFGVVSSIRYSFGQISAPLLTSTLALSIGFLVMTTGQFQFGARLGLITAICIFLSLLTVFSFLPAILLFIKRKEGVSDEVLAP